ncbi:hypothetical protein [Gimesia aquarii]|uniref:Uncharacterized protein n=1 Tax=Gimesia aquarii TaxID=2527964 RepID=A0A517WRP2_9PLAN|nr:hypothetical protein [Gimesia aquarii]QDU07916.1 hypothetical protein V202x_12770 [Gimesia aquarii]
MSSEFNDPDDASSIYEEAPLEADRHKWIESQKTGFDLGKFAISDWYANHWYYFCMVKKIEHLLGNRCWQEFSDTRFGFLKSLNLEDDLLADLILDRIFWLRMENLDIIIWAREWNLPLERVMEILELIDINSARLEEPALS